MSTVMLYDVPQVVQLSEQGLSGYAVVNRTDFNLFQGVTNEIDFLIKNYDRRPSNLHNKVLEIHIVHNATNRLGFSKVMTNIDDARGHCRLTITPSDFASLENGSYRYSVTEKTFEKKTLLYTDQNRAIKGYLEVLDGPIPGPQQAVTIASEQFVASTWGSPLQTYRVAEPFRGAAQAANWSGQHTLALYSTNFSGKFHILASLENGVPSNDSDWFSVSTHVFNNETGLKSIQFVGNYMWLKFYYEEDPGNEGTIDKALLKN